MDVEDVFSSKLRMKILLILMQLGQLNVSEIARRLRVSYSVTRKNLQVLEDEGILQHRKYGRTRLYRIDHNSPKTVAVQSLIETWNVEEK